MIEIYEVFDASNDELLSELQNLQQLLRAASGPNHVQYKMLYDTVRQELEERGVSNKLFQQLAPKAPPAAPTPSGLQPVAALYSFGSFAGAGGGGGGAAVAGGMPYGGHGHPHLAVQVPPPSINGSGIAHAVNAMVAATTARHATPASPTSSSACGHSSHNLLRNLDAMSSMGPGKQHQPQQQLQQPQQQYPMQLRRQPSGLQLPLQPQPSFPPTSPPRRCSGDGAGGPGGPGLVSGLSPLGHDSDIGSPAHAGTVDAGALASPSLSAASTPGARSKLQHYVCGAEGSACSLATSSSVTGAAESSLADVAAGNAEEAEAAEGAGGYQGPAGGGAGGGGGDGGKPLSVWEAAMKAFQEEQRLLRKARKAIRKGPPAKPPARKPSATPIQPHSHHSHHYHSPPPPVACETSQAGSTRGGPAPRPTRGSSCGSGGSPAGPGAGSGPGARPGGAPSPHGATAAAASTPTSISNGIGSGASSSKAGVAGNASAAAATRQAGVGGSPAGKAAAAAAAHAGSSAARAQAHGIAAANAGAQGTAMASAASPMASSAAAGAGAVEADTVAEEQGLQARTQAVVAGETAGQQREASEPESVKTDEESSDLLAAVMREAAAAAEAEAAVARNAAAAAAAGEDSEPESVSSGASGASYGVQEEAQQPQRQQQQQQDASPSYVAPRHDTRPASARGPSFSTARQHQQQSEVGPSRSSLPSLPVTMRPAGPMSSAASAAATQQPAVEAVLVSGPSAKAAAAVAAPRSAWAAAPHAAAPPAAHAGEQPVQREVVGEAETVATESEPGTESDGDNDGYGSDRAGKGRSRRDVHQQRQQQQQQEEARRRAIAAAAAAAIQGRSAADPSSYVTPATPLARAVIASGPMRVDRWADWELADSTDSLSAWATEQEQDPMMRGGGHLRTLRPTGQHVPPESLVQGPPGAHGLAALPVHPGPPLLRSVGSAGSNRRSSRQVETGASSRLGSAGSGGRGSNGGTGSEPGGGIGASAASKSCSSDGEADGCASDGVGGAARRARRKAGRTSPQPRLAPSARPSGGTSTSTSAAPPPSAAAASATPAAAAVAVASPARRPPLGPSVQAQPQPPAPASSAAPRSNSAGPSSSSSSGAASSSLRGGGSAGGTAGSATTSGSGTPSAPASASAAPEPNPGASYLQFFSTFHEILTLCYSALPVMLDAAALSSASVATVAGGSGGSNSRPASRMMAAITGAASGLDLLERYAGLLARCEAWQAKLRLLSQAAPEEEVGPGMGANAGWAVAPAAAAATAVTGTAAPSLLSATTTSSQLLGGRSGSSGGGGTPPPPPTLLSPPPQVRKYVAIIDDTAHPEVRNVVTAAVQLLSPAWALDPADQVTELARPDPSADDDVNGGGSGTSSAANSRPGTALSGGGLTSRGTLSGLASGLSGRDASGSSSTPPGSAGGTSGGGRCHLWNVLWSWSVKVRVPANELLVWQRVNHFAEARQLTRKDLLKKHLAKYQAMHNTGRAASLFDRLTPTTFVLPKEAAALEEAFVRALHGVEATCVQPVGLNLWIQKPVGLSRGRGISLISSLRKLNAAEPTVVQRYLTEPLLVEGFKFDLRLYVLVTSFNPLEAWMYEEGFARFTTLPYTLDEAELCNMHVHLTNSSVQRTRADAGLLPPFLQAAEPAGGSKTSLATLRQLLARQGVEWSTLWCRVCEVATAALFAAQDAIPHSPNSFELFGFDMMIDAQQKVWLLEVNSSPSMGLDTPLDRAIKPRLIADVLELLAPLPFDREALAGVLRARANTGRGSRRGTSGLLSGTVSEERELLCADLQAVLGGTLPRRYGERPRNPGGFSSCLAPSPFHDRLLKLRRPLPG
ncbi:hypothetical protein Agub_g14647 [Astrephomene gubernaculifera]|uniref:Tubulin--tyrosine ligase-like protein 9 n=1 Tax=Astrephomene gubernaculifera TaxID=47775 RepID=A0AAD3HTC5_9CHLO|nr:hypothetical protein Agub_g14647 [Astrephomene gubernaculifera]